MNLSRDDDFPEGPLKPSAQMLVAFVDCECRIVCVNSASGPLLGYEPADLLGRRIEDITPPALAARTPDQWRQFLADGRQDGEFRLVSADGREVPLRFQARAHYPIAGYHLSQLRLVEGKGVGDSTPQNGRSARDTPQGY